MKYLTVLLVIGAVSALNLSKDGFPEGTRDEFKAAVFNCAEKNGFSKDDSIDEDDITNENILCFMKCVSIDTGLMKDNGEVLADKIKEMPHAIGVKDEVMDKVVKCLANVGRVEKCTDIIPVKKCVDLVKFE